MLQWIVIEDGSEFGRHNGQGQILVAWVWAWLRECGVDRLPRMRKCTRRPIGLCWGADPEDLEARVQCIGRFGTYGQLVIL